MKVYFYSAVLCSFILASTGFAEIANPKGKGDHSPGTETSSAHATVDVESVFKKYKLRHEETVASLKEAAETLQKLMANGDKPPTLILSLALSSELLRLKKEEALIRAWEEGTLDKGEYLSLMGEGAFILEHLKMLAAFAKAAFAVWENRKAPLTEAELMVKTAQGFDAFYSETDKLGAAYYDGELRAVAKEGRKMLEVFLQLFDKDVEKRIRFRANYFSKYAENLVQKNEALILNSESPKK